MTKFGENGHYNRVPNRGSFKKGHRKGLPPHPNSVWKPEKNPASVRISCITCRLTTTANMWKKHRCYGPWFDHPDYDAIVEYCKGKWLDCHKRRKKNPEHHDFLLQAWEVRDLLEQAGIRIGQTGRRKHQYHLARYGDTGDYVRGNCRFITASENVSEGRRFVHMKRKRKQQ